MKMVFCLCKLGFVFFNFAGVKCLEKRWRKLIPIDTLTHKLKVGFSTPQFQRQNFDCKDHISRCSSKDPNHHSQSTENKIPTRKTLHTLYKPSKSENFVPIPFITFEFQ